MFPKDLRQRLIAHLRRVGYLNITQKSTIAAAKRGKNAYECAQCKAVVKLKETHGDHIVPVIDPRLGFIDWNTYMERLFMGQLQRLCIPCHKAKSKEENAIRREVKKENAQ